MKRCAIRMARTVRVSSRERNGTDVPVRMYYGA